MLASLIASFASGETALVVRRARRAAIAYLLAGVAALCGIGFLIGAVYIWASQRYGAIEAALGIGVIFLLLSGLVLIIHTTTARIQARRAKERRASDLTMVAVASALAVLPTLLRGKAGLGAVIAPLVALTAYAIYRENRAKTPKKPDLAD
jgi:Na+-transporting methylmalonyl-CoA/oxaloacetate decarboxylase gamma subunit